MMKTYQTAEIASLIGVHPNTIRFYEAQGLLPPVPRTANGYRIYSGQHLLQLQLVRCAFKAEILSVNLRNEAIEVVKTSAKKQYDAAIETCLAYQRHIHKEIRRAHEAIVLTEQLMGNRPTIKTKAVIMGRREMAAQIGVSINILRDWERNGLIHIPRVGNRRQYGPAEMNRLKIISLLRRANYSQMSIRRMFQKIDHGETNLLAAIDMPEHTEDIISVADRYLTSLSGALHDTKEMLKLLKRIKAWQ